MYKAEQIAYEYASNRMLLKAVNAQIKDIIGPKEEGGVFIWPEPVDMDGYRKMFYEESDDYGCSEHWQGWVHCIESCCDIFSDDEDEIKKYNRALELAKLFDRKKEINSKAGTLKRRLYLVGAGIVRRRSAGAC